MKYILFAENNPERIKDYNRRVDEFQVEYNSKFKLSFACDIVSITGMIDLFKSDVKAMFINDKIDNVDVDEALVYAQKYGIPTILLSEYQQETKADILMLEPIDRFNFNQMMGLYIKWG